MYLGGTFHLIGEGLSVRCTLFWHSSYMKIFLSNKKSNKEFWIRNGFSSFWKLFFSITNRILHHRIRGPRRWDSQFVESDKDAFHELLQLWLDAHQLSLERDCSLGQIASKHQLRKEWASQGRGGSPRREYQSEKEDGSTSGWSTTLAIRVSEQVRFLLHWCRIPVFLTSD